MPLVVYITCKPLFQSHAYLLVTFFFHNKNSIKVYLNKKFRECIYVYIHGKLSFRLVTLSGAI